MERKLALAVSMIALVTLALPAVAVAAKVRPRSYEAAAAYRTNGNHAWCDCQAPRSAAATNTHVYHGGPKAND
jgi:hypothetical protein